MQEHFRLEQASTDSNVIRVLKPETLLTTLLMEGDSLFGISKSAYAL